MNHLFKRTLALLCMLALLLSVAPLTVSASEAGEFTVLSTTDMHGRCWDKNILNDTNMTNSMLNVATAVKQVRAEKENIILIDNGDTYQGTPVSSYPLSLNTQGLSDLPAAMAVCLKEIGYDYSMLGNHEFNYGWKTMTDVYSYLTDAGISVMAANLYYDGTDGVHTAGTNVFKPYDIKEFTIGGKVYKIATIAFENTDCPRWDVTDNYPGIVFTHPDNTTGSIAWEANRYVPMAKADGADFIIVAYHSGLGGETAPEDIVFGTNSENQIISMLKYTSGIDMVIAGHDHSTGYSGTKYEDKDGKEVIVVNGGGNNLTSTTFAVNADGTISLKEHKELALSSYAADAALKEKMQPYYALANEYVNQVCGTIGEGDWSKSTNFYLEQTDTMDFVNRAQIYAGSAYLAEKYTGDALTALYAKTGLDHLTVDISSTSVVVSGNYTVQPGTMSMKDIYKLYRYDNSLYLLPMSGQQIKDLLEWNAENRLSASTITGTPVIGTKGDSFTNPVFYGLDFKYDLSKPAGEKVIIDKFSNGNAFELDKTYIMAVNNYHLGNGPFAAYSTEDTIWSQTDDLGGGTVQDMIAKFLGESKEPITPAPSNWEIVFSGEAPNTPASGTYVGKMVTDPKGLIDGDQVLIYHIAGNQFVTNAVDGGKLQPSTAPVNPGYKQAGTDDATAVFTVKVGADGYLRFTDAEGHYMTSGATGGATTMTAEENDYSLWELESKKDAEGVFYIHSVNAAYNGNKNQYFEYYYGFNTYGFGSGGGAYEFLILRLDNDCAHANTEVRNAVAAGCTTKGYSGDTYCLDCGRCIATGSVVAPTGHHYEATVVAPTCTESGYTLNKCSGCGDEYKNKFTEATGHDFENGTCNNCGAADPDAKPFENPFTDVADSAWYYSYVMKMAESGIINGYTDGTFLPENNLTRAEMVTLLYKASGSPAVEGTTTFTDVPANAWYMAAVTWAEQKGIVNGVGDGEFEPEESVSREQLVTMLWRLAGKPAAENELTGFEDTALVNDWAVDAFQWAVANSVINGTTFTGKPGTYLAPQDNVTRAEAAKILCVYTAL